jgi:hypothetical protein
VDAGEPRRRLDPGVVGCGGSKKAILSASVPVSSWSSCSTAAIRARQAEVVAGPSGLPSTSILPEVGSSRPSMIRIRVVLPVPDGPTMAT